MISTPTVLILGAGASSPYEFPTGHDLVREIIRELNDPGTALAGILQELDHSWNDIRSFKDDLWDSGQSSVDAFVEYRQEYTEVGKAAIAYSLVRREQPDRVRPGTQRRWYEYLFGQLTTSREAFLANRLSIITFNYDRSLEFSLFKALMAQYRLDDATAIKTLHAMDIVHVHGQLGRFTLVDMPDGRPFEPDLELSKLRAAIGGIEIMHEGQGGEMPRSFIRANSLLKEALVICFLGFGFSGENLRRLGIQAIAKKPDKRKPPHIWGTAYHLGAANADRVRGFLHGNIELGRNEEDVLTFLHNHPVISRD